MFGLNISQLKNLILKARPTLENCVSFLRRLAARTGVICVKAAGVSAAAVKRSVVFAAGFIVRVYADPVKEIVRSFIGSEGRAVDRIKSVLRESRSSFSVLLAHTVPVACAALFVSAAVTVANTDMVLKVVYDGRVVGYVTDKTEYDKTIDRINSEIGARFGKDDYLLDSETVLTLANRQSIVSADELYNNILSATESLREACGIYSEGELVAVCDSRSSAEKAIETRLEAYRAEHENCGDISIAYGVEIKEGLFPAQSVMNCETAAENTACLSVMENTVETYNTSIKYKTVSTNSSSYVRGTTVVKTEGKNGVCKVTAKVSYIDGVEVSREELETEVVSEPVNKVVLVGTKKPVVAQAARVTWPLDANAYYVISAYWGDGRNHQAIDIACDRGTAILAAKSGTVVEVVYNHRTYGHYLTIDHGNGIRTRYAHCNSISVKEGQSVSAGQVIAAVGRTGRATGYHLHFEYILNGERIDPSPYLGV